MADYTTEIQGSLTQMACTSIEVENALYGVTKLLKDKIDEEMIRSMDTPYGLGRMRGLGDACELIMNLLPKEDEDDNI